MSFDTVPQNLEKLVLLQMETNQLLNALLQRLGNPGIIATPSHGLATPALSAESMGRPLTAAEAPLALQGIANVEPAAAGNAQAATAAETPAAPAPTQAAPVEAPAASVAPASASPSEVTEDVAKARLIDVSNKVSKEAAVAALRKFDVNRFPELMPTQFAAFVAHCDTLLAGK